MAKVGIDILVDPCGLFDRQKQKKLSLKGQPLATQQLSKGTVQKQKQRQQKLG
jgi:hypothetical protein